MATETTQEEKETKPTNKMKIASIIVIILGLLICAAGIVGFSEDDELNAAMIEVGMGQSTATLVLEHPGSKKAFENAAYILEAAVRARQADPEMLTKLLTDTMKDYPCAGLDDVIASVVNKVNAAYSKTETEDVYLNKLQHIVNGIRSGISQAEYKSRLPE